MTQDFSAARRAMVDCQVRPSDVTRYGIIEGMLAVPRERFVPRAMRDVAYAGVEIPLGEGRALLEPRILAKMLEAAAVGRAISCSMWRRAPAIRPRCSPGSARRWWRSSPIRGLRRRPAG